MDLAVDCGFGLRSDALLYHRGEGEVTAHSPCRFMQIPVRFHSLLWLAGALARQSLKPNLHHLTIKGEEGRKGGRALPSADVAAAAVVSRMWDTNVSDSEKNCTSPLQRADEGRVPFRVQFRHSEDLNLCVCVCVLVRSWASVFCFFWVHLVLFARLIISPRVGLSP